MNVVASERRMVSHSETFAIVANFAFGTRQCSRTGSKTMIVS